MSALWRSFSMKFKTGILNDNDFDQCKEYIKDIGEICWLEPVIEEQIAVAGNIWTLELMSESLQPTVQKYGIRPVLYGDPSINLFRLYRLTPGNKVYINEKQFTLISYDNIFIADFIIGKAPYETDKYPCYDDEIWYYKNSNIKPIVDAWFNANDYSEAQVSYEVKDY